MNKISSMSYGTKAMEMPNDAIVLQMGDISGDNQFGTDRRAVLV